MPACPGSFSSQRKRTKRIRNQLKHCNTLNSHDFSLFLLIQQTSFCTLVNSSISAGDASMYRGVNGALKLYDFMYSGEGLRKTQGYSEKLHRHMTFSPQRLKQHPYAARTHHYLVSRGCATQKEASAPYPHRYKALSHSWTVVKGFDSQFFSLICLRTCFISKKLLVSKALKVQGSLTLFWIYNFIRHPAHDLMAGIVFPRDFWHCNCILGGSVGIRSYP